MAAASGERGEILALEVMHVLLAAGARDHRELHVERLDVVANPLRADERFEALSSTASCWSRRPGNGLRQ